MIYRTNGSLRWLEFELLAEIPGLIHGSFLRSGGVSKGAFGSLNVSEGLGDEEECVLENRKRIAEAGGFPSLARVRQVHGAEIVLASTATPVADGLMTNETGVGLMIQQADCQAALFYDPIHRVIANVHAGWRGNVQNIYAATLQTLHRRFHTQPRDILVAISPSLGPCCAEFKNYREEFPASFASFQVKPCYFNLWDIALMQLEEAGVLPHHIQVASICTRCHPKDYFSYRRDKITGRQATIAGFCNAHSAKKYRKRRGTDRML